MAQQLPPELLDRIIDHLHDDKRSLKSCAQTCKQLVPVSRQHLLDTITFPLPRRYTTLEFFLDEFPAISASARVLLIKYCRSVEDIAKVVPGLHLLPRLPFVCALRLDTALFWREMLQLAPTHFARITTLELRGSGIPSFDGLKQMLLAMPQLIILRLDGSWWATPPGSSHEGGHSLSHKKLDLRSIPNDFIEWFVRGLSPDRTAVRPSFPRTLCIQEQVLKRGDIYSRALLKNSTHLHLYSRNMSSFIRLLSSENLETLVLDYSTLISSASMASAVLHVPRLSSITIRCLVIGLGSSSASKGAYVDWGAPARALLSKASSPLLKTFIVRGRPPLHQLFDFPEEVALELIDQMEGELSGTAPGFDGTISTFPRLRGADGRFRVALAASVNGVERMREL